MTPLAREMWTLYEPVHDVTYFTPEAVAAYEAAGLRGYWRGYFAGRAAPLGPVGAPPVVAAFFGFAPAMVERALPDVWTRATPERTLAARVDGATAALARVVGGLPDGSADPDDPAGRPGGRAAEAADLLERAADGADVAGRVLGAAHAAALPRPADDLGRLWRAATVLREHRGDGHVAALVAADLDGAESLVLRAGLDMRRESLQPFRGWTDDEWAAARGTGCGSGAGWTRRGARRRPAGPRTTPSRRRPTRRRRGCGPGGPRPISNGCGRCSRRSRRPASRSSRRARRSGCRRLAEPAGPRRRRRPRPVTAP